MQDGLVLSQGLWKGSILISEFQTSKIQTSQLTAYSCTQIRIFVIAEELYPLKKCRQQHLHPQNIKKEKKVLSWSYHIKFCN